MWSHDFPFEGGNILSHMGVSWFVSYAYFEKVDRAHNNWSRVKTAGMRLRYYEKGRPYHDDWLKSVMLMNDKYLNTNTIGLDASEIKRMARSILEESDL